MAAKIRNRLVAYARASPVMDLKIRYKDEIIKFNLDEEMRVDESHVNQHLKSQIRNSAFLNILQVKLSIQYKNDHKKLNREIERHLVQYKGKFKTLKEAEAHMYADNPSLRKMEDALLELEEFRDTISACVKSFESRQNLLQSLSANVRNENKS